MLHFTCDLCGKTLTDERFVAKIEVFPAHNPEELTADDLDADHLEELAELLAKIEDSDIPPVEVAGPKHYRFDLCCSCQSRYTNDPLGRNALKRINFSQN